MFGKLFFKIHMNVPSVGADGKNVSGPGGDCEIKSQGKHYMRHVPRVRTKRSSAIPSLTWPGDCSPRKWKFQQQKVFQGGETNTLWGSPGFVFCGQDLFWQLFRNKQTFRTLNYSHIWAVSTHSAFHREALPGCLILLSFWIVRSLFSPSSCFTVCHL